MWNIIFSVFFIVNGIIEINKIRNKVKFKKDFQYYFFIIFSFALVSLSMTSIIICLFDPELATKNKMEEVCKNTSTLFYFVWFAVNYGFQLKMNEDKKETEKN